MNFKNIISLIFAFGLFASFVLAGPPSPEPMMLTFTYNGNLAAGMDVDITLGDMTITRATGVRGGELGKIMFDIGEAGDFKEANFDYRTAKVIVECNGGLCDLEYDYYSMNTPFEDTIELSSAPPVVCEPCDSCCNCKSCEECEDCNCISRDDFCEQPDEFCNEDELKSLCGLMLPDFKCEDPDASQLLGLLIAAGVGGAAVAGGFIAKKKFTKEDLNALLDKIGENMKDRTGFRIVKWNGTVRAKHYHSGITGYHDPFISHRDEEDRHEPGRVVLPED